MIPSFLLSLLGGRTPAPVRIEWPEVVDEERRLTLLEIARLFLHVREIKGQQNRGARVEAIQRWSGGKPGDSWCCQWVTMVLDLFHQGKSAIPREGSCDVVLALAKDNDWLVRADEMDPGDIYLRLADPTDAVHIGFCTTRIRRVNGKAVFGQISGNTSADGKSNNGDGVYERDIEYTGPDKLVFVRLPRSSTKE